MKTPAEPSRSTSPPIAWVGLVLAVSMASASAAQTDRFQARLPSTAVAEVEAARELVKEESFDTAVERLESLVQRQPGYYRGHYNLGLALAKSGRADEALKPLERALEIKKEQGIDDPTLLTSIGWTQYLAGQYPEAKETLEEALRDPGLTDRSRIKVLNNLGTVHKRLGEFEAAKDVLQQPAQAGSSRAQANLKVIQATERMRTQLDRASTLRVPEASETEEASGGGG